jgi:hypothetical protein
MSLSNSIISNLTNEEIEIDFKNSTYNSNSSCKLAPSESIDLNVFNTPYEIILKRIGRNPVKIIFETIITSYLSIMQDHTNKQLYIQDFLNDQKISSNKIYNPNSAFNQVTQSLGKIKIRYIIFR